MNRSVNAVMFIRLSGTDMHCDHTVHSSADLTLELCTPSYYATQSLGPLVLLHFHQHHVCAGRFWCHSGYRVYIGMTAAGQCRVYVC